jgi:hypothetical protein
MRCRSLFAALALVATLVVPAFADRPANGDAEIGGVLRLVAAGVSDEVIVKHIRAAGYVFDLTTDDIVDLRHQGVSDTVLEAMLDTAIDNIDNNPNGPRSATNSANNDAGDDVDRATTTVTLSAGWFSPWYQYPYAWGSYYDPFPVCYSYYYYPFRFCNSWGYYGHNRGYYYCDGWAGYRWWDDIGWYDQCRTRPGCRIPIHRTDRLTWQAGRALPANHGIGRVRMHNAGEVYRPRRERWSSAPRLDERFDRSRLQVRQPGGSSEAVGAPRGRTPESVQGPRSHIPEPAQTPRQSPPPPAAPRNSSGHESAPAPSPRGSMSPPPSSVPPAAGRSGGVSMAPRGEPGGRSRLRP